MAEIIYSKYSNERSRRFAIRTDILEENKKRWLQKKALYPEGKEHMDNLASRISVRMAKRLLLSLEYLL